jgi:hypothetical protein
MKERKELAVGESEQEAWENLAAVALLKGRVLNHDTANAHYDFVHDEQTGLWSVYHKRKGNGGRQLRRVLTRESREAYTGASRARDRRPLVLSLLPTADGELISMRLKGTRRTFFIDWNELYRTMIWRYALAAKSAKRKAKADRRKARHQGKNKR